MEYRLAERDALTDTGTSCIIGPSGPVGTIREWILSTSLTVEDNDQWGQLFDCTDVDNMPKFELLYGGYWFEVLPEDYVTQVTTSKCSVCIRGRSMDYWILGDVFVRGWYNIHDHDRNRMGFVPHIGSTKVVPEAMGAEPEADFPGEIYINF